MYVTLIRAAEVLPRAHGGSVCVSARWSSPRARREWAFSGDVMHESDRARIARQPATPGLVSSGKLAGRLPPVLPVAPVAPHPELSAFVDGAVAQLESQSYLGLTLSEIFRSGIYHDTIYANVSGWGARLVTSFATVGQEAERRFASRKSDGGLFSAIRNILLRVRICRELEADYREPIQKAAEELVRLGLVAWHKGKDQWRGWPTYCFTITPLGSAVLGALAADGP